MEVPQIKLSNSVLIGIAVGAAILAIVLFYENQSMRKQVVNSIGAQKKPCGCQENQTFPTQMTAPPMRVAGVHDSVFTGRLDSQPMPAQSLDDPEHPPEVIL